MFLIHLICPLILTLVLMFPLLSNPLGMGLNLLMITILGSVVMSMLNSSAWISYAIILVLLGGLLVIFIYVALLASNEIFMPSQKILLTMIFTMVTTMIFSMIIFNEVSLLNENFFLFNANEDKLKWLSYLYSNELWEVTLFLISYLLLTLIVVVYNTKNNLMSLRSFKN